MIKLVNIAHAQLQKIPCPEGLRCPGDGSAIGSANGVAAVNGLITLVINWMLGIAFGLAVLFLVIGGLRYIVSGGNEESADKAKKTIVHALVGIVIVILSYVVLNVLVNFLSGSTLGTSSNFAP